MVSKKLNRTDVEELAAAVLAFLATDDERFGRFLSLTGLQVDSLRDAAKASGFSESLFDYVSSDERLLLTFAAETGRDPHEIEAARLTLVPPPFEF